MRLSEVGVVEHVPTGDLDSRSLQGQRPLAGRLHDVQVGKVQVGQLGDQDLVGQVEVILGDIVQADCLEIGHGDPESSSQLSGQVVDSRADPLARGSVSVMAPVAGVITHAHTKPPPRSVATMRP